MKNSLVSICIPTYNGEKYLQETLDSVKAQTYRNIEVIISDDESKDSTIKICEKFREESGIPVYIYSHQPQGIGANWNYCIEKANGHFIKLLFQDDVMENNCIEVLMDWLTKNNLEIVVSKRSIIDTFSNTVTAGSWYDNYKDLQASANIPGSEFFVLRKNDLKNFDFVRYSQENIIGEPTVSLFTKSLFRNTGPFRKDLKQILDYEYWLRVLVKFNIGIVGEKLVKFRYHENQASFINSSDHVSEGYIIKEILFRKFLFYIDRKNAKNHLLRKYPLLMKIVNLKYKILSWKN